MKSFETYQYLAGEPMTDRDKTEVGSKFWNKGKWDNFVLPFLPNNCADQTFIDIGCNAGLFCHLASEHGFRHVFGIDSNERAVARGREWRDKNGQDYKLILANMEDCVDDLPVSDVVVLANVHYYFRINKWLDFLDKLQYKTRHCIIVTADKRSGNRCWAQADLDSLENYFKSWRKVGFVDSITEEGDPRPRKLWSFCFKSSFINKISVDELDAGNHVQDEFYSELDSGKHYKQTKYYKIIEKYRLLDRRDWTEDKLQKFFKERVSLYNDVKENGLRYPIIINSKNLILDGNHRYRIMKHLGYKEVFVRRI